MSQRACSKCGCVFPETCEFFHIDTQKLSGFRPDCKECARGRRHAVYLRRKDREIAKTREWERANRTHINALTRAKLNADPERREKLRQKSAAYKLQNRQRMKEKDRAWMQNNRGAHVAKGALARARRRHAAPPWLTTEQKAEIKGLYRVAAKSRYHVDHICPIAGATVCGLHVPWNLQVLPPIENMKKGNRHVPT